MRKLQTVIIHEVLELGFVFFIFLWKLLKHEIFGLQRNFKLKNKSGGNRHAHSCFFPEAIEEQI